MASELYAASQENRANLSGNQGDSWPNWTHFRFLKGFGDRLKCYQLLPLVVLHAGLRKRRRRKGKGHMWERKCVRREMERDNGESKADRYF